MIVTDVIIVSIICSIPIYCRPNLKFLPNENSENVKDVEKILSIDKLQPADHLDGVRLEQDGMLNKDFHKEVFLGNHEEIDEEPAHIADSMLKDIFRKVDTDDNGHITLLELKYWITDKIRQHFDEALEENDHIFKHMDPDGDGLIDWKDYYKHFLLAKKYDPEGIDNYLKDYEDERVKLKEDDRNKLIEYKFKWVDVEQQPLDNKLNKEEFLAFRHPEQSPIAMKKMVESIINALDQDSNGKLTEKEFTALAPGDVEDPAQQENDLEWTKERRKEFREAIDVNKDGIATKDELLNYLDPRNPAQSEHEAASLIEMLDDDKDKEISLYEVLKHKEIFINSKAVNVKRSLHDEF